MKYRIALWFLIAIFVFIFGGGGALGLPEEQPSKPDVEGRLKALEREVFTNWPWIEREMQESIQENEREINELETALQALEKD